MMLIVLFFFGDGPCDFLECLMFATGLLLTFGAEKEIKTMFAFRRKELTKEWFLIYHGICHGRAQGADFPLSAGAEAFIAKMNKLTKVHGTSKCGFATVLESVTGIFIGYAKFL